MAACLSGCGRGIGPLPQAVGRGGGRRMGREGRRGQGERGREGSDVAVIINYDLPPVAIIVRQISSNYIFMKRSYVSFDSSLNYISYNHICWTFS